MRPTIPAARIGGKETDVAKDSEKTPAQRLNQIRKEWGLEADEPTAKAQTQALEPLQKWLLTGVKSPEVVIRAVQVLLADPEIPGVDQRPAIDEVSQQVSEIWANSGQGPQGVLGLQAMVLAAWPYEQGQGWFVLTPMLDSAWAVMEGRSRQRRLIKEWRGSLVRPAASTAPARLNIEIAGSQQNSVGPAQLSAAKTLPQIEHLRAGTAQNWDYYSDFGKQLVAVLDAHAADLKVLSTVVESQPAKLLSAWKTSLETGLAGALKSSRSELELVWWGQARYSRELAKPYRRIKSPDERLWWMAFECARLAIGLDVEPAASFFVETLCQAGDDITEKRPLKQWIRELVFVLRDVKFNPSKRLAALASNDSLGLPVTWAWLESAKSEHQNETLEERAHVETGLSLGVEIDRGEWASWVFREVLLDWHLEGN